MFALIFIILLPLGGNWALRVPQKLKHWCTKRAHKFKPIQIKATQWIFPNPVDITLKPTLNLENVKIIIVSKS